jgi:hypothetical protein
MEVSTSLTKNQRTHGRSLKSDHSETQSHGSTRQSKSDLLQTQGYQRTLPICGSSGTKREATNGRCFITCCHGLKLRHVHMVSLQTVHHELSNVQSPPSLDWLIILASPHVPWHDELHNGNMVARWAVAASEVHTQRRLARAWSMFCCTSRLSTPYDHIFPQAFGRC